MYLFVHSYSISHPSLLPQYHPLDLPTSCHGAETPRPLLHPSSCHLHALSSRPKSWQRVDESRAQHTPHIQGSQQSTSTTTVSVATGGLINRLQPRRHGNSTPTAPYSHADSAYLPYFPIWTSSRVTQPYPHPAWKAGACR